MGTERGGRDGEIAAAAARLRHDLGKYIRFGAPESLEADTEALRARLRRDVLETRSARGATQSAPEVFDAWRAAERAVPAARIAAVAEAIDEIRGLAGRIDVLSRGELERLDALTARVAAACRRLAAVPGKRR